MHAFREIVTPKGDTISISIPPELTNRTVEVILLPFETPRRRTSRNKRLQMIFDESRGILPDDYVFDRDEAHER